MRNKILILTVAAVFTTFTACYLNSGGGNAAANQNANAVQNAASNQANSAVTDQNASSPTKPAVNNCGKPSLAGKTFIRKQTFPIDFKPFNGSCFVTFGSTEDMLDEKDVPRGSTFYIYREGKQIFEFPDAFGGQPACWIEGVLFNDLNGDGLTDVALAGSCLAAKNSYPSNAVYVNTGSGFTTNDEANARLENFKTLKEIETFVKKNVTSFF